jgi:hypothetical protein
MKVKCDNMLPTMMKTLMKVEFFRKMNHYSVTPAFLALNKPLIKSRVYFKILPLSSIVSPKPQPSFSLSRQHRPSRSPSLWPPRRAAQCCHSVAVSHLTGNPGLATVPLARFAATTVPEITPAPENPENPAKIFSSFSSKFLS